MPEDKKKSEDRIQEELLNSEDEATQANKQIQDEFYSEEETTDQSSSPVPYVANNTAPLNEADDKKKKK